MIKTLNLARLQSPATAVGLVFMTLSILYSGWIARIPEVQSNLGLTKSQLGFSLIGLSIGALSMTITSGWLSARMRTGLSLTASTLLFCICIALPAFAWDQWSLLVALFAVGAGNGFMNVSMNAAAAVVERSERINIMPFCHAMYSLGLIFGALIASFAGAVGISVAVHLSVLGAVMALAYTMIHPVLNQLPPASRSETRFSLRSVELMLLVLLAFCFIMSEGAIADWTAVYLKNELGSSVSISSLGYACFAFAMTAGRFSCNYFRAILGVQKLMLGGVVITIAGLLLPVLLPSVPAGIIGFAIAGLGIANLVPVIFAASAKIEGIHPGAGIATVSTAGLTGLMLCRPVIGGLSERWGLDMGLVFIMAMVAIGGLLTLLAIRRFRLPL
ncbi:MAG: MFS transporter [Saprospiraceae bacterium]|nr:MFS transporter [Saprospiraceae bacterium]